MRRLSPELDSLLVKSIALGFALLMPVVLGLSPKIFGDGDVSWHIAAGNWILAHGQVPQTDPFQQTRARGYPTGSHVTFCLQIDDLGYARRPMPFDYLTPLPASYIGWVSQALAPPSSFSSTRTVPARSWRAARWISEPAGACTTHSTLARSSVVSPLHPAQPLGEAGL